MALDQGKKLIGNGKEHLKRALRTRKTCHQTQMFLETVMVAHHQLLPHRVYTL